MSRHDRGWQEVGDRVFRFRYRSLDLNVGAVLGEDEVLVVDTRSFAAQAAELLGLSGELGTLAPGRRADVVVVDGDPFELATLGDRIAAVVKDGRLVAGHV